MYLSFPLLIRRDQEKETTPNTYSVAFSKVKFTVGLLPGDINFKKLSL